MHTNPPNVEHSICRRFAQCNNRPVTVAASLVCSPLDSCAVAAAGLNTCVSLPVAVLNTFTVFSQTTKIKLNARETQPHPHNTHNHTNTTAHLPSAEKTLGMRHDSVPPLTSDAIGPRCGGSHTQNENARRGPLSSFAFSVGHFS